MQKRSRRNGVIAVLTGAALSLALSACGSSSDSNASPKPATASTNPVVYLPAAGDKHGVTAHGKSIFDNSAGDGLSYTCAAPLKTVSVGLTNTDIEYNGVQISYSETSDFDNIDSSTSDYPQQTNVTVKIDESKKPSTTKFRPVSAIVELLDLSAPDNNDQIIFDQFVVNMNGPSSFTLNTSKFDATGIGSIDAVNLCVDPR